MAKVDIEIRVLNAKRIDDLKDKIDGVDKTTKVSTLSLAKWGAALGVATVAVKAISDAGRDYQEQLNKMTGKTDDLTKAQERSSASFGQFSQRLMDVTTVTEKWTMTTQALDGVWLHLTSFITGESIPSLVAEQEALEKATASTKKLTESKKESIKVWDAVNSSENKVFTMRAKWLNDAIVQKAKDEQDAYNESIKAQIQLDTIAEASTRARMQAISAIAEQFNYANGMNPAQAGWKSTWDGGDTSGGAGASSSAGSTAGSAAGVGTTNYNYSSAGNNYNYDGGGTIGARKGSSGYSVSYPGVRPGRGITSMHSASVGMATGGSMFGTSMGTNRAVVAYGGSRKMTMTVPAPEVPIQLPEPTPIASKGETRGGTNVSSSSSVAGYATTQMSNTLNKILMAMNDTLTINRQILMATVSK